MLLVSLLLIPLALVSCAGAGKQAAPPEKKPSPCDALLSMFHDGQYAYEAVRAMGGAPYSGADVGECLVAVRDIREGDDESWYRAWRAVAGKLDGEGEAFRRAGDRIGARECFFRASGYFRSAEFFLHANPRDPRILETWRKSRDTFLKGAALSDAVIEPVEIPYGNTTLPGYFCLAGCGERKRPLLIINTGFDGTAEELYFSVARAAVERGFHCLIFEGPGQGGVIREQGIFFRPDWENVVTPAVDFVLLRRDVDPGRIALMGISMGGYLAPRAAAFEPRIRACIANGGVYDFFEASISHAPPGLAKMLDDPEAAKKIDKEIYGAMKTNSMIRWVFNDGMWKFGAATPSGYLRKLRDYTLKECVGNIRCPVLVVDSECDTLMPGQSKILYDRLAGPKTWMPFTGEEGAGLHCQAGASVLSNGRILHWLMERFEMLEE